MPGAHEADEVLARSSVREISSQSGLQAPGISLVVGDKNTEFVSLDSPVGLATVALESPLGLVTADGLSQKWIEIATFLAEMGDDLFQQMVGGREGYCG